MTNSWSGMTATNAYKERVRYDANGNIQRYDRYWNSTTTIMDSLTYTYTAGTNKLLHIKDIGSGHSGISTEDIESQPNNNYAYDEIGNMTRDSSSNIRTNGVRWNVYGKIAEINRTSGASGSTRRIVYTYDAAGNRISKKVTKFSSSNVAYTWYVRDAQGNVLQTYSASKDTTAADTALNRFDLLVNESYIFGSSRVGQSARNSFAEANFGGSQKFGSRGQEVL